MILIVTCCFSCSLPKHTHHIDKPQFAHSSVGGHFKLLSVVGLCRENCSEFLVLSLSAWRTLSFLWVESSSLELPWNRSCQTVCVSGWTILHITSSVWASLSIYITVNLIPSSSLDVFQGFSFRHFSQGNPIVDFIFSQAYLPSIDHLLWNPRSTPAST